MSFQEADKVRQFLDETKRSITREGRESLNDDFVNTNKDTLLNGIQATLPDDEDYSDESEFEDDVQCDTANANVGNIGNAGNTAVDSHSFKNQQKRTITASTSSSNATDLLKRSLIKFFSEEENIERFLAIIKKTSPVSLRLLDYFCVNYSRSTQVVYMIMDKYFDVHSSYKNQLKTFSKKMFDPFKRNTRITFRHENERFDTTLGQLCFFKWCLTHNVLDYVEKNIVAISDDMKKNTGKIAEEQRNQTEKKRRTSRRRSAMNVTATRVPTAPGMDSVIVSFD